MSTTPTPPKRKGHRSSTTFKPGQSGNPSGAKKQPPELRAALAANTLPLYEKGLELMKKAEESGDLRTATTLLLGLLKKSLPDAAQAIELSGRDGAPLAIGAAELRVMSDDDLAALKAIAERAAAGAPKP